MGRLTAEKVAQRAFDLGLLDERQLQQVWGELGTRTVDVDKFVQLLVRRELLTNYQVERLLHGERTGFFFGDYKVLYLVGAGTFARVYRAAHKDTGKVVAVKVLRKRYSETPAQFSQFIREGELGRTLRHPNIVPIYETYSRKSIHFLVMEFVEGHNLRQFLKVRKKIEPVVATRLMTDIASGLRYAFENGLTHRDLKLSNVLISSRGKAKLVDFGLASIATGLFDNGTHEVSSARTIDYAALERATGVRKDDTRSDIYFMGCIYYHMLSGKSPLAETRDRAKRLEKARFLKIVPIQKADPTIPHSVTLVVNKAMILDPERRYQTPAAMLADLAIAAKRLADVKDEDNAQAQNGSSPTLIAPENQRSVMVVESNTEMQDVFRSGFKRAGYRVLLTSDPDRAVMRFREDPATADCVLFNAQEIGNPALKAFNRFGKDRRIDYIPAILLLDEEHIQWKKSFSMFVVSFSAATVVDGARRASII